MQAWKAEGLVVVLLGSPSDMANGEGVRKAVAEVGVECHIRVTSAHKGPDLTLKILSEYEGVCTHQLLSTSLSIRSCLVAHSTNPHNPPQSSLVQWSSWLSQVAATAWDPLCREIPLDLSSIALPSPLSGAPKMCGPP